MFFWGFNSTMMMIKHKFISFSAVQIYDLLHIHHLQYHFR